MDELHKIAKEINNLESEMQLKISKIGEKQVELHQLLKKKQLVADIVLKTGDKNDTHSVLTARADASNFFEISKLMLDAMNGDRMA